jgi:hypothetical protein
MPEGHLSLDDRWANVKGRSERSRSRVVQMADMRVEAARDSAERPYLVLPKAHESVAPTHWAFGQLVLPRYFAGRSGRLPCK